LNGNRPMFDRQVIAVTRYQIDAMADRLVERRIHADTVTWIGFIFAVVAVLLIAAGHFGWAILAIAANRTCDGLDGAIARKAGKTDRGAFLDITLDFLFYSSIPLSFALHDPTQNALAGAVLIFAFIGTGNSFLAFAIMAERRKIENTRLPDKGFYYLGGLTEATETILVFVAMCLFPDWFPVLAYVFAALCTVTTISRIVVGMQTFD